jgi:5-methylcytosine-specific restriction endonuclease McrA
MCVRAAPRICGCGYTIAYGERCPCQRKRQAESRAAFDRKRPSASERGYDSRWAKARATYLAKHPICSREGCNEAATHLDHVIAHRGDQKLFWDKNNWAGLCAFHHNSIKQTEEKAISKTYEARTHPFLPKPRIPVTVVCGPPGSGKSTYVMEHAGQNDLIIDLDVIKAQLSGAPIYTAGQGWTSLALEQRNNMLKALATDTAHERCWFIVSAPTQDERETWCSKLNAALVLLDVPLDECIRPHS